MILEIGHLHVQCTIPQDQIDDNIWIKHKAEQLHYSLIGYTIHTGLHFYLKTKHEDCWYIYDGLENPKLIRTEKNRDMTLGRINCVLYALIDIAS